MRARLDSFINVYMFFEKLENKANTLQSRAVVTTISRDANQGKVSVSDSFYNYIINKIIIFKWNLVL